MITRAMIAKNVPNDDGTWDVFIPILSSLPRDAKTRDLLTKNSGAKVTEVQKNNYNPQLDSMVNFDIDKSTVLNTLSSVTIDKLQGYTYRAVICGLYGVEYNFSAGDVVFVMFENNDMTRPVILGALITNQVLERRLNNPQTKFVGLSVDSLNVNNQAKLPNLTNINFSVNGQKYTFNSESFASLWGSYTNQAD